MAFDPNLNEIEMAEAEIEQMSLDMMAPEGNRPFRPLDENDIKAAISREIMDSHGAISSGSQIAEERRQAIKMYYGQPLGNEVEGRSQVVLTEVADTIHWLLPSLIRMFASGEDVFEFEPIKVEDTEMAEQATQYINHIFWEELDGFQILYDWFFTTLLEKNGFVRVDWEEKVEPKIEMYFGITTMELQALMSDGRELQIIEFEEIPQVVPVDNIGMSYNVTVKEVKRGGCIKLRAIPPEEFMIARREIRLDDHVQFVGERRKMTASDLIAMGFDPSEVEQWPTDESPEFSQGRTIRLSEEETFPIQTADRPDAASREMWINDIFMRIDVDGDGYSELRHFMCIGDTGMVLLSNEYANFPPFASLTASPVAHKFFGQSIHDLVGDLQIIRTTIMRQMLDNLYLQNNPRNKVVRGEVEIADLLTSRPGGVVRMDSLESMMPLETAPLSPITMEMMNYLDQIRETRVGVSRWTQGLDGSSLNGTATGVNAMMGASQQRIELMGRIFAKTGMRRLGQMLLRMMVQYDNKARMVKLRGKWVEVNPSQWNESMNCRIKTGLGIGSANEMIGYLMAMAQLQKDAMQSGATMMVTPKNLYTTVSELAKAMGFNAAKPLWTDPGDQGWPEPPPDPKVLEHERRVQDDQAKNQIKVMEVEIDGRDKMALDQFRNKELDINRELKLREMEVRKEVAEIQARAKEERGEERDD